MHGRDNRVIEQKLLRVAETKCIQANYQRAFNLQNVFITPILKPFPQLLGLSAIFMPPSAMPLPPQDHKSGTVCRPISDYVGCHTACSSGGY